MANYIQHSTHHPHFMFISHIFILIKINNDNFISLLNQHIKICILAVQHTYSTVGLKKLYVTLTLKPINRSLYCFSNLYIIFVGKIFWIKKTPCVFSTLCFFLTLKACQSNFQLLACGKLIK